MKTENTCGCREREREREREGNLGEQISTKCALLNLYITDRLII